MPDALSRNPLPDVDLLPPYAVIRSMDLHALPSVIVSDRPHVRQLQLEDPVTGVLLYLLKKDKQSEEEKTKICKSTLYKTVSYTSLIQHKVWSLLTQAD